MQKWWHVSWKRLGLTLLVLFGAPILLGVTGWLIYDYQFSLWSATKSFAHDYPELALTPTEPPVKTLATLSGRSFDCFGVSFKTPWNGIYRESKLQSSYFVTFNSGEAVQVESPDNPLNFSSKMFRRDPEFERTLGRETVSSNYSLFAAAMQATPDRVKWWRTRGQNGRDFLLLLTKLSAVESSGGPIRAASFGATRGFQIGDPSKPPYKIHLDLFDALDRHYQVTIQNVDNKHPALTQAEVNAIVASVSVLPNNAVDSPLNPTPHK